MHMSNCATWRDHGNASLVAQSSLLLLVVLLLTSATKQIDDGSNRAETISTQKSCFGEGEQGSHFWEPGSRSAQVVYLEAPYVNNDLRLYDHRLPEHSLPATIVRLRDDMRAPSTAALLVLASICLEQPFCSAQAHGASTDPKDKAKYQAACPAYEHYARFPQ